MKASHRPFIPERQAGKLFISISIVFGFNRPETEPKSTVSVADALSTRPLIGYFYCNFFYLPVKILLFTIVFLTISSINIDSLHSKLLKVNPKYHLLHLFFEKSQINNSSSVMKKRRIIENLHRNECESSSNFISLALKI